MPERERGDRPAAERVADEVGPVEGERAEEGVQRGHAARNPVAGAARGASLRPEPGPSGRSTVRPRAHEEARRAGPVRRVRAEAVEEDDGALGRERPEHPDGQPRAVVGREDLAVRAGDREPLLHDGAVRGERIDGERAEEEEEEKAIAPSRQLRSFFVCSSRPHGIKIS